MYVFKINEKYSFIIYISARTLAQNFISLNVQAICYEWWFYEAQGLS